MSNLDTGTATEQPADDIRSALAAAMAESEAPDIVETPEPDVSVDDTKSDRVRGPDGKFAKKEDEPEPVAEKPDAEPTEQEQPKAETKEPPTHWSAADKEMFKAQPEAAQKFMLDRVKAMEGDYTKKTQAVAELKKEYGPVDEMFAPHKDVLRQKGFTPRSLIEAWANVEQKLAGGTDSAVDVIKGLVSGYGIPAAKIAQALGLATPSTAQPTQQPTAVENGQTTQLPPQLMQELEQLRQKVTGFETFKTTQEQREAQAAQASRLAQEEQAEKVVTDFKSEVDEKGNLKRPHFSDVEDLMTVLANGYIARKQNVPDLPTLYEMAVNAHPDVRQKVLTAQKQQEETKRKEEARVKAVAAKKAGSSVTGAPGSGQAPSGKDSGMSIRESLEAALDDVA